MKDHNPGKSFASPLTDENEILMPFFHFNLIAVCDVKLYFINSPGEIGTSRCLLPFPSTLIKPSSK